MLSVSQNHSFAEWWVGVTQPLYPIFRPFFSFKCRFAVAFSHKLKEVAELLWVGPVCLFHDISMITLMLSTVNILIVSSRQTFLVLFTTKRSIKISQ